MATMATRVCGLLGDATRVRHVAVVGADATTTRTLVHALVASTETARATDETAYDGAVESGLTITPVVVEARDLGDATGEYLVNVIEARDSADCVGELDPALALCDGVLVVVDYGDGVGLLVETALRKAVVLDKQILLLVDKMGKLVMGVETVPSSAVERVDSTVNAVIRGASTSDQDYEARRVDPALGTVAFGSLVGGWGFTIAQLSAVYAPRFDTDESTMTQRLWPSDAHGRLEPRTGDSSTCGFDALVAAPLRDALQAIRRGDDAEAQHILTSMGVYPRNRITSSGVNSWLPLRMSVLNMILRRVPSPATSPQTQISDDRCTWSNDIKSCRARGALVAHVVKLLPPPRPLGRCLAVARVLSGRVAAQQDVHVVTPSPTDLVTSERHYPAKIEAVGLLIGNSVVTVTSVIPAGSLCVLSGVDEAIHKTGVITTCEPTDVANSFLFRRLMAASLSFIPSTVRVTLTPRDPKHQPALVTALERLASIDRAIECNPDGSGQLTLSATSPKTLRRGITALQDTLAFAYSVSAPTLCYRETVALPSPRVFLSKSPNKNVKLRCEAEPLDRGLARDLLLSTGYSLARRQTRLANTFGWGESDVRAILSGLDVRYPAANLLLDETPSRHIRFDLLEEPMVAGFAWATSFGVLCEEPLFGVLIRLRETWLFGMERHWKRGQIIVAMRRIVSACQLASSPALLAPVFTVEISCHADDTAACMTVMQSHGAQLDSQNESKTSTRFHVPAAQCFDLDQVVRAVVREGNALSILAAFDHYEQVDGDPLDPGTPAGRIVREIRLHKNLEPEIRPLDVFHDTDG